MRIVSLSINNFRGLENIFFEPDKAVNVIVGPNAIGKSTILEAIRLLKAMLAPRFFQETQQALLSLGALPQNHQFFGNQQIDYAAIARDPVNDVRIALDLVLSNEEVQTLKENIPNVALGMVGANMARTDEQTQFALSQYLSSREGIDALNASTEQVTEQLRRLETSQRLSLTLTISGRRNAFFGNDPFAQIALSVLDQRLPAQLAAVSYFPADRAFPPGEVAIQIGSGDAAAQIQSHVGNPVLKYQRLKQTIVHGLITHQIRREWLDQEFNLILENLVPGKRLKGVTINQFGQLKVIIEDIATGKAFDIDSMSSGEKGVILTFLLIRHSVAKYGLLLIDEPELHLNPAVSKKLLAFLIDHCVTPMNLQVFTCTHSPEVLGAAFDRDDTNLFHLRSSTDLTKVFRRDQAEMFEALRRLGASTADVLFSRGTVVVEGEHDAEILNEGFFDIVSGYKITQAGGRDEVEKEIQNLQDAEEKGEVKKLTLLILDLDRDPTIQRSTTLIRVLQWDRYCLENYLIESDVLFDIISEVASRKPESRGSFASDLKPLAMSQLNDVAIRWAYDSVSPDDPNVRVSEIAGRSIEEAGDILVRRLIIIRDQTRSLDQSVWVSHFRELAITKAAELKEEWERDWIKRCSGKKLIRDLYKRHQINLDPLSFKKRVIKQMRTERTESWRLVESRLREAIVQR